MSNQLSRTITESQRLQLVGLLCLAEQNTKAMSAILKAALEITKETDDDGQPHESGHTSDAMYCEELRDVDRLLHRLNITVEDGQPQHGSMPWRSTT